MMADGTFPNFRRKPPIFTDASAPKARQNTQGEAQRGSVPAH